MAQVDVAAIRDKLAEVAGLLGGLTVYTYQPDTVHLGPEGAVIVVDAPDDVFALYHQTGGVSDCRLLYDVTVIVPTTNAEQAQRQLDAYRGVETPRSLVTQLEAVQHFDGLCHAVTVVSATPAGVYSQAVEGGRFWSVTFEVEVLA